MKDARIPRLPATVSHLNTVAHETSNDAKVVIDRPTRPDNSTANVAIISGIGNQGSEGPYGRLSPEPASAKQHTEVERQVRSCQ